MTKARRSVLFFAQILFLIVSMAGILSFGPPAQATETRRLVLTQSDSRLPFTDVVINGVETSALIDTAATIPVIGYDFLDLQSMDTPFSIDHEGEAQILGIGGTRYYPITRLTRLSAGSEKWTDLRVAVNSDKRFPLRESVLPISIFDSRIVDFDFGKNRVYLYDGWPKRVRRKHRKSVSYHDVNSLIFVPVKINGVSGKALIDTGADTSFVNMPFAEKSKAKLDAERSAMLRGSDLSRNHAAIYQVRRIEFSEFKFQDVSLPALETDLFSELGFGDEPMMVFGMDLLQHFRVQIDRGRQRVRFVRST